MTISSVAVTLSFTNSNSHEGIHLMADFLDEKRREMQERLKELRPLVDEFHRLEAAVAALDGVGGQAA
ncbi:MAG TPA: hypothetical protein VNT03_12905, partial [Baekduia sp.]|nr:hypothetical protein [Baekduia sp.]